MPYLDYFATEYHDSANNKKNDLRGGILVNSDAMRFFKENHDVLFKAVILEWCVVTELDRRPS